ncbi:hypothetical protein GCM10022408_06700 [Hymenobacter fastidiosus]|uniref:Uncharacterized protein n=1 Tax=Hymenobacter fastidiosus TaxID=486264 RepID=A0ABP7RJR7_9BACT
MTGKRNAGEDNKVKLLQRAAQSFVIAGRAATAAAPGEAAFTAGKRLLQRIRTQLRKPARAYVSVAEFCAYTSLPEAEVAAALNRR